MTRFDDRFDVILKKFRAANEFKRMIGIDFPTWLIIFGCSFTMFSKELVIQEDDWNRFPYMANYIRLQLYDVLQRIGDNP
ncbi:hypothetical protein QE152_g30797 [Popillia japonica]|uniref:Uncharacterized protein n=1 Tax=Popillia japonica TaxID=7064 RepID=A0AAW1JCP1_POPJA